MGWDFHSFADAQNQRSRGLPGFLPGAPDPDHNFQVSLPNPGNQVWQPALPPPDSLPPGLEYLSQVFLSLYFYTRSPLKWIQTWFLAFQTQLKNFNESPKWEKQYKLWNYEKNYLYYLETNVFFYSHFYYPYLFGRVMTLNIFDGAV